MEESLDDLYKQFVESRKKKIRELIEVQEQMSIAEEVSRVRRAQDSLQSLLRDTDSAVAATKLSSEIRANSSFMMEVMGLGKDQLTTINQASTMPVLPNDEPIKQIGVIEEINFDED